MLQAMFVCLVVGIALGQTEGANNTSVPDNTKTAPTPADIPTPTADYPAPFESVNAGLPPIHAPPTYLSLNDLLTWTGGAPISPGIPAVNGGASFVVGFAPLVKPGQCPPLRTHCLPGYSQDLRKVGSFPAQVCGADFDCPGTNKCCFDVCLNEAVCKSSARIFRW